MTDDDDDDDEVGGAEAGATGEGSPERVAKSERILNLIAVLLRSDEPVPLTEILGKVTGYDDKATRDSLMRRFERDKKVLRDMGIPVEHATGTFGAEGYTIPRTAYFLDEVRLPPASAQVLRALFAWAHGGGGELSTDLRTALVKVGYLVDDDDAAPPERAREALDPKLERGPVVARNLELLSEALFRRRRVRFRYYSIGRHEEQAREVDPWGLGFAGQAWNRGAWYLVGWCHLRQAERVFKVQRIRGEVALAGRGEREGPDYEIPAGFRVREHLGRTRWEYQDLQSAFAPGPAEPPFTARVAFEAPVASEVRALVPSARVVARDDEWETLEFDVRRRRPFARFLLRYVPRLRVVDPPDLDGSVRELAREVLTLYGPPAAAGGAP